jgi:putative protease
MKDFKKPEVLAPVQDFTTLTAAIQAGADAFFFGVRGFNMRVAAKNFTVEDLPKIIEVARAAEVKAYLALNIIVYEERVG